MVVLIVSQTFGPLLQVKCGELVLSWVAAAKRYFRKVLGSRTVLSWGLGCVESMEVCWV